MTTIAVDVANKTIASDSKVTGGGPSCSTLKIFKAPNGTLVAFAGSLTAGMKFARWVTEGMNKKKRPEFLDHEHFEGVTVEKEGVFMWDPALEPMHLVDDSFFVMGSGGAYALAALHLGKTIEEAILLASKLDVEGTGGKVRVVKYESPVRRKKAAPAAKKSRKA